MNIKAKTKIVATAGSFRTTVPKKIAELLNLEAGNSIIWNLTIKGKEPVLIIEIPKDETEKSSSGNKKYDEVMKAVHDAINHINK